MPTPLVVEVTGKLVTCDQVLPLLVLRHRPLSRLPK
jgi:hypothetical protein